MANRRLASIAVLTLLFVLTGVVAVAVFGRGSGEPLGQVLATGTLSSLIAAMLLTATRVVAAMHPQPPLDGHTAAGLRRVRPKSALTSDDWLELIRTAKTEFYVAGHSLGKWCSATNHDEFTSHVRRILDNDGRVVLAMLDPTSPQTIRLQQATSVDYSARIQTSFRVLANLQEALSSEARRRLTISVLKDPVTLPYMLVGNEQRLVTATYLGSTESHDVLSLELDRSSDAAAVVYDDFRKLVELGTAPTLPPAEHVAETRRVPWHSRWFGGRDPR